MPKFSLKALSKFLVHLVLIFIAGIITTTSYLMIKWTDSSAQVGTSNFSMNTYPGDTFTAGATSGGTQWNNISGSAYITGSLGVGTVTPWTIFEVHNGTNQNLIFRPGSAIIAGGSGLGLQAINDAHNAANMLALSGNPIVLSGNAGIGLTSPLHPLHVNGSAMFSPSGDQTDGIRLSQSQTNNPVGIIEQVWDTAGSPLYTNLALNPNGGNVGIGTTSPGGLLDVRSGGNGQPGLVVTKVGGIGTEQIVQLNVDTNNPAMVIDRNKITHMYGYAIINEASNPIQINSNHTGFVNGASNRAEIANDNGTYKTLMILGNSSAGQGRKVSIWDRLEVNGTQKITQGLVVSSDGGDTAGICGQILCVRGTGLATGGFSNWSDRRLKKNIEDIKDPLAKILNLRGVEFEYDNSVSKDLQFPEGKKIGLIAQEVEEIVPEVVNTGSTGYKSIDYALLTSLLIEGMKEQQIKLDSQAEQIQDLQRQINELKK